LGCYVDFSLVAATDIRQCFGYGPALAIILLMLFAPLTPVVISGVEITKAEHFFGWGCLPQNHCFEQVGLTLPFYAASAYSLGGLFARIIPLSNPAKPTDVLPQTAR
jgi:hypothetical protein